MLLITAWLGAGLLLIGFDGEVQPYLKLLGAVPAVHFIAAWWQQLGATIGIVGFLLAGLAIARRDRGYTFCTFVLTIVSAGIAVQCIKHLIGRARPNDVHDQTHFYGPFGLWYAGPPIQMDSMPSGHTTAAFAMAAALSYRWPKQAALWFVLAAGVGVARTLVDRHFPSDVLVASCFGTLIGWCTCQFLKRWESDYVQSIGFPHRMRVFPMQDPPVNRSE